MLPRNFSGSIKNLSNVPSIKYGQENEEKALKQYIQYMNNTGRRVKAFKAGCVINSNFPWLAASPDGILFDEDAGFGLIEVKCTYSKRNITPVEACMDPSFFCKYEDGHFKLKKDHEYYAQVQGQLGVCGALFCDFIAYTNKGLGIQRIAFDHQYWREMTSKLRDFFLTDFMPEIKEK